jgi:hypothetical protein
MRRLALARAGLRKEQVKSIIVTKDREFKRKAIAFLNGSAFAAEKFSVEKMNDGIDVLERDGDCVNIVFDGCGLPSDDLRNQLEAFAKRCKSSDARLMVYLDESNQHPEKEHAQKLVPQAHVFFLPMAQIHFNKAFHGAKLFPEVTPPAHHAPPPPREPERESSRDSGSSKASLTLIETSAHIKETVDMLNAVAKDKARIDTVREIGQRFNGLIGAFSFFGNAAGYPKLRDLSTIIDDISRTYREDHTLNITEEHWSLMMESAKTLYLILKDMRDNKPVTPSHMEAADAIWARYSAAGDIVKRASQSQDEIDALIEAELAKHTG